MAMPSSVPVLLTESDRCARLKYNAACGVKIDASARLQKAFDSRSQSDVLRLFVEESRANDAVQACLFDLEIIHHASSIACSGEHACMRIAVQCMMNICDVINFA